MPNHHVAGVSGSVANPKKQTILAECRERIMAGETLAQIANSHGITDRTLRNWLSELGDEYTTLRSAWVDQMLADAGEEIERADDQFPLARARELWKRATWYAERRDARYRPKQEVQQDTTVTVVINTAPKAIVIEGQSTAVDCHDALHNDDSSQ